MNGRAFAPAVLSLALATSGGPPARAASAPNGCAISGVAQPRVNANIEDTHGRVIARFSGSLTALSVRDFPVDGSGRARIETGVGNGSFRLRGFAAASELPLYALSAIPVVARNVFIAPGRSLTLISSAPGKLRVERRVTTPLSQSFSGWAPCSAIGLAPAASATYSPPGASRPYLLTDANLELFDAPAGTLLTTLVRSPQSDGVVFFSGERLGPWLRVTHHSDVVVEAWARARELVPMPPGDTLFPLVSATTPPNPARLAVQGEPRIVKPAREAPLRVEPKDAEPPIGVIEAETETFVLDVVDGWASVMPKALNVVPAPDRQFWVKAADLGL